MSPFIFLKKFLNPDTSLKLQYLFEIPLTSKFLKEWSIYTSKTSLLESFCKSFPWHSN